MRSDYLLYILAAVSFTITVVSLILVLDQTEKNLWVISTFVLGLFALGLGYYQRPGAKAVPVTVTEIKPSQQTELQVQENTTQAIAPTTTVETPIMPTQTSATATEIVARTPAPIPEPTVLPEPAASTNPQNALATIRGINANRTEQLKAVGIRSIEDLANASPDELASKLSISPKITRMWIGSAKKLKK
jgi:predicted flap endonuclease-1-like 5' DNA nuclease